MSTTLPFRRQPRPATLQPLPDAVRRGNRRSDYLIYAIVIVVLLVPGVLIALVADEVPLGALVAAAAGIILLGFILVRVQQVTVLANAMRLQSSSYTRLRDDIETLARELGMPPVDVLSAQNPQLNAYAFGFARPYTIVLHSGTIEQLNYDELLVIVLHEMAHVRYKHTFLIQFLLPLQVLPVIGGLSGWVINFWTRRNEYSADRLAVAFTGDPDRVIRALIKVHAGPFIGDYLDKEQAMYQEKASRGGLRRFAQTFSSHPVLVNRIKAIIRFADQQGYAMADDLRQFVRKAPRS